jgi:hypothetical protein
MISDNISLQLSAFFKILIEPALVEKPTIPESPNIQLFGARRMRAWHHHGGATPTSLKTVSYFFFLRSWRPRGLIF